MTDRPRKLLHVTSACTVGGAEVHVLALLGQLDPVRFDRWLAYFVERPDEARPMRADFQTIGVRTVDLRGRGQLDPLATARLARLLSRERFDLVHTHSLRAELAAVLAARLSGRRPRIIRTVHNTDDFYLRRSTSWLARWSLRQCDAVIGISDAVVDYLVEHARLPRKRLTRIYYGLDGPLPPAPSPTGTWGEPSSVAKEPPSPGGGRRDAYVSRGGWAPTIGMIARLAPQKGHKVLLDALPAVIRRFPALRVELVGHEHLTTIAELRRYAEQRGVAEHVSFAGFRDDLPTLLAGWDVFVLPSLWEGFGLVLLEAMAAGRPVVASRVGPIPEVVVDGETGLLAEPGRPEALADALIRVLEDPALARRLGEAGRRRVAERFGLGRMIAEITALYDQTLSGTEVHNVADRSERPALDSSAAAVDRQVQV